MDILELEFFEEDQYDIFKILKSVFYKNILKILLTKKIAEIAPVC